MSPKEMGEIVAANKFVAPTTAVITARKKVPNADVVRADLCKQENSFIYVIVALNKEGRAMHVLVSPESGKVTATK
ncbi:hypothetical protein WJT86_05055 [Microvirga sp. W0021]|uniref:PepSY domain-containing protein n=1 Tax=Hohaiivirga grylli TaxID=3133970 RepID=A0ABV0BHI9_9HYPH